MGTIGLLAVKQFDAFRVLVLGGGVIGGILWVLSFAVIALAIALFLKVRRVRMTPDAVRRRIGELFSAGQYHEAIAMTARQGDYLSYVVHAALTEATHGYNAMQRAAEEAADERTTRLLRSIEWLNLIGNIGPMLGLLGTVWGMIRAFSTIAATQGPADPSRLAGDIYTALVTTLLGLAVAIPALSLHAVLRNRIDALTSEAIVHAQELISTFRPDRA